jgi:hypothetical protein
MKNLSNEQLSLNPVAKKLLKLNHKSKPHRLLLKEQNVVKLLKPLNKPKLLLPKRLRKLKLPWLP